MHIKEIISRKKYGETLNREEIAYVVDGYTQGRIPDYQMAAFLMSVYFKGMDEKETAALTEAMVRSGEEMDLSDIPGVKVDKHSTGGVGDKISLVVMPVMAVLGIPAAKMSGRGLGHTGGTIDKLESVPGFQTELDGVRFRNQVREHGIGLVGQSGDLTPADKKIYALRDAIECVDSIPLIAGSIMSKKIASGADVIVLDVKVGDGSFMKSEAQARKLAQAMVDIGKQLGRKTVAVLTAMEQPLGREVGNACEVIEAVRILSGGGEEDEIAVAVEIAAHMAYLAGSFDSLDRARRRVGEILRSGEALEKFRLFLELQGGDGFVVDDPERLLAGVSEKELRAESSGYVHRLHAERIGRAAMLLGAGRMTKEDGIDHAAGIRCLKKIGEYVEKGEAVFLMRSNRGFEDAERVLHTSYELGGAQVTPSAPVIGVVE